MSEIEWVDELPERRAPAHEPKYGYAILDALRANPGKWAKLWTYEVTRRQRLPYVCDDCAADFSTPSGLKHHVARQHPESA